MKNKLYRKYIVLIVAAIASAVVWIQSFTQPNVLHPVLFGLLFTLAMALFVGLSFGMPRRKTISLQVIVPYLQSIGFEPSSESLPHYCVISEKSTQWKCENIIAAVYSFSSKESANSAYRRQCSEFAKLRSDLRTEKTKESADSCVYMRTTSQYTDAFLLAEQTVVHLHAPMQAEKKVQDIIKKIDSRI